jgi:hypothetical protein
VITPTILTDYSYDKAQKITRNIAASLKSPRFYRENADEVARSQHLFKNHPTIQSCLAIVATYNNPYGHGLSHAEKVSIDSGAIVLIECNDLDAARLERLVLLSHLAGALHDVKRAAPDHALAGAEEARKILPAFDLTDDERKVIPRMIANHEAFKPSLPMDNTLEQLLSDALYDADKFRWGPDNFTEMLWDIIIPKKVPLTKMLAHFMTGMVGIKRIRRTFRSSTGKKYGPDFIDLGLKLGRELHDELQKCLAT